MDDNQNQGNPNQTQDFNFGFSGPNAAPQQAASAPQPQTASDQKQYFTIVKPSDSAAATQSASTQETQPPTQSPDSGFNFNFEQQPQAQQQQQQQPTTTIGPRYNTATTWLEDLKGDLLNGSATTKVGWILKKLGAKGLTYGEPQSVAENNPILGPVEYLHGREIAKQLLYPTPPGQETNRLEKGALAANEIIGGIGKTIGPVAAIYQPEALPAMAAGSVAQDAATTAALKLGIPPQAAQLIGNVTGILAGGKIAHTSNLISNFEDHTNVFIASQRDYVARLREYENAGQQAAQAEQQAQQARSMLGQVDENQNPLIRRQQVIDAENNASEARANAAKAQKALDQAKQIRDQAGLAMRKTAREIQGQAKQTPTEHEQKVLTAYNQFKQAIPSALKGPASYTPEDYQIARRYLENHHINVEKISSVQGAYDAFAEAQKNIEQKAQPYVEKYSQDPIATNPVTDVRTALLQTENPVVNFVDNGMKELQNYGDLDSLQNLSIGEADRIRENLNAQNRAQLAANRWDIGTALETDPKFAARYYLADSLRNGIYNAFEQREVSGIRQMRRDETSIIRLRNAAEKYIQRGESKVRGSGETGYVRQAVADKAPAIGAVLGSKFGKVGVYLGEQAGEKFGKMIAPGDLTRDELIAKSLGYNTNSGPVTEILGEGVPPSPREMKLSDTDIRRITRESSPLHSQLATHYGVFSGDVPYGELEQRFMDDIQDKQQHGISLDGSEKQLLKLMNEANDAERLAARQRLLEQQATGKQIGKFTRPEDSEPLMQYPKKLPNDASMSEVMSHELAHFIVANELGIPVEQDGIRSHLHPENLGTGTVATVPIDWSKFTDEYGQFSHEKMADKLSNLVTTYVAGGVANDLYHDIPFTESKLLGTDLSAVKSYMKRLGMSDAEISRSIAQSAEAARQILSRPGMREIIEGHAGVRESGLSDKYHFSPERLEQVLQDIKDGTDETTRNNAGDVSNSERPTKKPNAGVGAGAKKTASGQPKNQGAESVQQSGERTDTGKERPASSSAESGDTSATSAAESKIKAISAKGFEQSTRPSSAEDLVQSLRDDNLRLRDSLRKSDIKPEERTQAEQRIKENQDLIDYYDSKHPKNPPKNPAVESHSGGQVASEEELARPGRFVKVSRSGQLTDQGKTPDFNLREGEAGYQVYPNGKYELKAGQETPATARGVQNYAKEVFKPQNPAARYSEISTGNPERDEIIRSAGAVPGGAMKPDPELGTPELVMFHDPQTESTLMLKADQVTPENIKNKLEKSRAEFAPQNPAAAIEKSDLAKQADEFNRQNNREPIVRGTTHNSEVAKRIADAYDQMKHEPENPAVKKSYDALKKDIDQQWNYAQNNMGIKFEPWTKPGQPYANSGEMSADVKNNHHLYFFQGGEMPADHPLAEQAGQGLTYNDKLRAVHDLFGHAAHDYQFGPKGEENAWNVHRQMFSPEAIPAVTTETRGQNSWVNFGKHLRDNSGNIPTKGEPGYIPPTERPYAEQKAGLLPVEFERPNPERKMFSGVHYSPVERDVLLGSERGKSLAGEEAARLQHENRVPGVYAYAEGAQQEPQISSRRYKYNIIGQKAIADINPNGGSERPVFEQAFQKAFDKYKTAGDNDTIAQQKALNDAEAHLRDLGYDGYQVNGSTFLYGDQPITRTELGDAVTRLQNPAASEDRISARVPFGTKATENPLEQNLRIDRDAVLNSPNKLQQRFADRIRQVSGVKIPKNITDPMKVYDRYVNHLADNLQWLHDQVPSERRQANARWYDTANKLAADIASKNNLQHRQAAGVIAALSPQTDWDMNVDLAKRLIDIWTNHQNQEITPELIAKAQDIIDRSRRGKNKTANSALEKILPSLAGKTIGELSGGDQALAMRLYDEVNNKRDFPIIDPGTGEETGLRLNDDGTPASIAWGNSANIAKALSILENGSRENIHQMVGNSHKVRSFYNNIIDPANPDDVTVDTHAVAAGTLLPLGGDAPEVLDNFGRGGKSVSTGVTGTYPIYADAYRQAAERLGLLPRQLQSIAWEQIRDMFPSEWKNNTNLNKVRSEWQKYADGKQSIEQTRNNILDMSRQAQAERDRIIEKRRDIAGKNISALDFLDVLRQARQQGADLLGK